MSICSWSAVMIDDFVSPLASVSAAMGSDTKASITPSESSAATRMSMSPIVSRKRRRLPAYSARATLGSARIASRISAAMGNVRMIGIRRSSLWRPSRSIAVEIFSSDLAPRPGRVRSCCSATATLSCSTVSIPSSRRIASTVLGPSPGIRINSTRLGGYLSRSFSRPAKVPDATYSMIFSAVDLPMPGSACSSRIFMAASGAALSLTAPRARS